MANPSENPESVMEKITEKIHDHHLSSSSSDSENEKPAPPSVVKAKVYRMFGRERPVHKVLGGGKHADILLWRNKKTSGSVLGVATAIWVVFEMIEYHLLTIICHILMLFLTGMFLWSNANSFINKTTPRIPEIHLPEEPVLQIASALTLEINQAFAIMKDVASGKKLKKFLKVIGGLWVLSIVGSWFNFLTLFYISNDTLNSYGAPVLGSGNYTDVSSMFVFITDFVLLYTLPVFYEKYEDKVDPLAEKAAIEFKKQYAVFDAKVLSKIPRGPLKFKKV